MTCKLKVVVQVLSFVIVASILLFLLWLLYLMKRAVQLLLSIEMMRALSFLSKVKDVVLLAILILLIWCHVLKFSGMGAFYLHLVALVLLGLHVLQLCVRELQHLMHSSLREAPFY